MKKLRNQSFVLDRTTPLNINDKIKRCRDLLRLVFYKCIYAVCKVKSEEKKYNVSVCAIFKNESLYLKEWIEFNHIVGVEHFYLYNNNSEDDYLGVLEPYISKGLVTLVQWPKNQAQMECYNHCINTHKKETKWMGFIDIDEFIIPRTENSIYDLLKKYDDNRGSVKLYWKMFGTSGIIKRNNNELVTEQFTVCWPKYYIVGKCFYNTSFSYNPSSKKNKILHHSFWANYRGIDIPPVNIYNQICFNELDKIKNTECPMQINHYFTKSYDEYRMKKAKGDVYFKINPHDEEYFFIHEHENLDTDFSAYKYLVELKLKMQETCEDKESFY